MNITVGKLKKILEKYDDKTIVGVTDEVGDNRSVNRVYISKVYFDRKMKTNDTDDILILSY